MQTESIALTTDLEQAYFQYAVETITDRALPRVEDGLKPVQRRILFAMHDMGLRHDRPQKKSARIVGEAMGKYHPHGDQSVYMAMVRMAQDFAMRHPLIDGQGNFGCFSGDTKIKLLDGTERSFEELATLPSDEVFYVYSVDEHGRIVVGEGRTARMTRQQAQVVELTLDNGEKIHCTPDHRFMLRDGSYKAAQDLTPGESLMAGYFRTAPVKEGLNEYLQVLQPASAQYEFVHHLADRFNQERGLASSMSGPFVRHHKNGNRRDNRPTNIERMEFLAHLRLHAEQLGELWKDDAFRQVQRQGVQRYYDEHPEVLAQRRDRFIRQNQDAAFRHENGKRVSRALERYFEDNPEIRAKISRRMRALWEDPDYRARMSQALTGIEKRPLTPEQRAQIGAIISEKSRAMWSDEAKRAEIARAIAQALSSEEVRARLREATRSNWQDPKYRLKYRENHFAAMAHTLWQDPATREKHRQKIARQRETAAFRDAQRAGVRLSNARRLVNNPAMMSELGQRAAAALTEKWQDPDYGRQIMRRKIAGYVSRLLTHLPADGVTPEVYEANRDASWIPRVEKALTYFEDWDDLLLAACNYNHRVVSVEWLEESVNVYDITVDRYHNFLLAAGVFVHNSIDGDSPAAMRYTEARLAEIAGYMLQDIDQETVDFVDNFDGSLQEPVILPAALPNLLVNGATGIAVGMATSLPPHNLGEVCEALIYVAQRWKTRDSIRVDELMKIVPGPDFPTGGVIYRYRDDVTGEKVDTIREAYETGRGRIVMQARIALEEIGGGKVNIVVTELPYAVQKSTVLERIAREVREGQIGGVTDLRDESDHEGMRAIIEVSRVADAREVLESVLAHSQLRETFGVNALALVSEKLNGDFLVRPQRLSLREMLVLFVNHRLTVIVRRSQHELAKREARLHIVEGLLKALDIIDQVIDTIRRSRTAETAEANLVKKFGFSELQAQAILAMQLRRLAALERRNLADEEKELRERIKYLKALLRSEPRRLEVVVEETKAIQEKFATPRKTVILSEERAGAAIVTEADLVVPQGPQVVAITTRGLQRSDASAFTYRVRAGVSARAVEAHRIHLQTNAEDRVVLVSNLGRAWWGAVGRLPVSATFADLGLEKGEEVVAADLVTGRACLVIGTKQGQVKRTKIEDLTSSAEATWSTVIGLGADDRVLFAGTGDDQADVLFFTDSRAIRFTAGQVNPQATPSARGVAGIKLGKEDRMLGGANLVKGKAPLGVVVVSQTGYAKWVALDDFPVQGRGGQGVALLSQTKVTGPVVAAAAGPLSGAVDVLGTDEKRQRLADVPVTSRVNRGEKKVEIENVAGVVVL